MVNFARNRCFAAKNRPQTMIFHQKTSKTIDFPWFSLSELSYSKSQQPTCLLQAEQQELSSNNRHLPSRGWYFSNLGRPTQSGPPQGL